MKRIRQKCKNGRKGMTLVELLVAMACGTMIMTMLLTMVVFMSGASDNIIEAGEQYTEASALQEYIRSLKLTELEDYGSNPEISFLEFAKSKVELISDELYYNEEMIFDGLDVKSITFSKSDNGEFIECRLGYEKRELNFTAWRIP